MAIVWIVLILALVTGTAKLLISNTQMRWARRFQEEFTLGFFPPLLVGSAIAAIVCISVGVTSINERNDMTTFYEVNHQAYETAVERLKEGIAIGTTSDDYLFDAANLEQVKAYADTIASLRSEVVEYNKKVTTFKYWQDNWFLGGIHANLNPNVEYIGLE